MIHGIWTQSSINEISYCSVPYHLCHPHHDHHHHHSVYSFHDGMSKMVWTGLVTQSVVDQCLLHTTSKSASHMSLACVPLAGVLFTCLVWYWQHEYHHPTPTRHRCLSRHQHRCLSCVHGAVVTHVSPAWLPLTKSHSHLPSPPWDSTSTDHISPPYRTDQWCYNK